MKTYLLLLLAAAPAALAALPSVGPDYVRPEAPAPAVYRDSAWQQASPAEATPRGPWWKLFADQSLDELEQRALARNQDLRATAARVAEAAASAGIARSAYWPQLAVNPSVNRSRMSTTTDNPFPVAISNDFTLPLLATWEIDVFGRVRRQAEGARDDAESAAATFEAVRLSLTASVATVYFTIRATDREMAILHETVDLRRHELDLVSAQRRSGAATELDTARAETELASAEADTAAVSVRRESLQDALAVFVGESASSFAVPTSIADIGLPSVPPGLPSGLLERRPDIAAAERSLAAANARIGVAKAAFFPAISLTGSAGFDSGETSRLFGADSRIWSIGPALYLPLFQGGRNRAALDRSKAAYDESIATYRQQVLVAFREVQEALTTLRLLSDQSSAQERAVAGAKRAASLAETRYRAGYVSYLEVIDAQRTELDNERTATQLFAQRLNTDVALIKALGGGWSSGAVN